jgi:hypothetical protein
MPPIKIERGFASLAQRDLAAAPPPPPKRPAWRPWMTAAAIAVVIVLGVLIAVAVRLAGDLRGTKPDTPPAATPAPDPAVVITPVPSPVVTPPATPDAAVVPPPATPETPVAVVPTPATPAPVVVTPPPAPAPRVSEPPKPSTVEVPLGSPDGLLCEYFENLSGNSVAALRSAPAYPDHPDRKVQLSRFELPRDRGAKFGARLRGFLVPPVSGRYRLAVCVDHAAELLLSSDDQPAHAKPVINVPRPCGYGAYDRRPEQQSDALEFDAGRRYYIEVLMKQGAASGYLQVGWRGPEAENYTVIEGRYLKPWSDAPDGETAAAVAIIAEQRRVNATAYRFAEAAQALGADRARWQGEAARTQVDQAILRFALLAKLRTFVQEELARTPLRGAWVSGSGAADVTGAADDGVTVAPGRVIAWADVPPEQMLRFVNQLVPKAGGDDTTRGRLALAAAAFCLDFGGGVELALKYRERAVAAAPDLAAVADRMLGEPAALRANLVRAELVRLAALAAKVPEVDARLAAVGVVGGLSCAYWDNLPGPNLDDALRRKMQEKPPSSMQRLTTFDLPLNRGDAFAARVQGYIIAPETGVYTFFITGDDRAELALSADETPANLKRIARLNGNCAYQAWANDGERKSAPINLVKGTRYWVEAVLKEEDGRDHLSVGWKTPSNPRVAVIPADCLAGLTDATLSSAMEAARRKTITDLFRMLALGREMADAQAAAEALPSGTDATELQRCVMRAQAAARELDALASRADASIPAIRSALQAAAMRTKR